MRPTLRSEEPRTPKFFKRFKDAGEAMPRWTRTRSGAPTAAGRRSTTTPSAASPPRAASTPSRSSTSSQGRVLEVGVGTGLSLPAYRRQLEIVGIDLSPEMLEKARERVAEERLTNVTGLHEMDAGDLKFPDASFDTVVAMYVMTVVPDPEKVMRELARVCRPGGEVLHRQPLQRRGGHARLGGAPHGAVRRQARLAPGVRHRPRAGVRGPAAGREARPASPRASSR